LGGGKKFKYRMMLCLLPGGPKKKILNSPPPPKKKKPFFLIDGYKGRFDAAAMITGVRMNTDRSLLIREY